MDQEKIKSKFGDYYTADENTFKMGIDRRISNIIADRFVNRIVLETCTGAGFTTIALALAAKHVYTIEIEPKNQEQAIQNVSKAGLSQKVTFVSGDSLKKDLLDGIPAFDSAFLDPDWADTKQPHTYKFINSNTRPPADLLLKTIFRYTKNIVLILPPKILPYEFINLPEHELQSIYFDNEHVLYCLYFSDLAYKNGETKLVIKS